MDLIELYNSRLVRRWHNSPNVPTQTIGDHSFGMCLFLMALHPNPSRDLYEAVIRHDLSEFVSGDFPHSAKNRFPVLREIDEQCATEFAERHELRELKLADDDKLWLKLLDQLEPLYYLYSQGLQNTKLYEEVNKKVIEYTRKLQTFGYFTDATKTFH